MRKSHYKSLIVLLLVSCFASYSCDNSREHTEKEDQVDRAAILSFTADSIIIPSYELYQEALISLEGMYQIFQANPDEENLQLLRNRFIEAYTEWQGVSIFEIGKAEELNMRNFTNIFPCDTVKVNEQVRTGIYNLQLPSTFSSQGFPTLDFLLYGLGDSDIAHISLLQQADYRVFMSDIIERLIAMNEETLLDWNTSYRHEFVANSGRSATASIDKLTNDYIFYYEKFLRAGKIGIPAGIFSPSPLADKVEGFYSRKYSKQLLMAALSTSQKFFNGESRTGATTGPSLASYLLEIQESSSLAPIEQMINDQYDEIYQAANTLDNDFYLQVVDNNVSMLTTYDEMQKLVVLLKVDMLQALNISVDFVDADGD